MIEIKPGIYKVYDKDNKILIQISKEYFEKEAIMEAIYEYNRYQVFMKPLNKDYVGVFFTSKNHNDSINIDELNHFFELLIHYQIKRDLDRENSEIKKIIIEYAYSSIKKKLK